MNIIFLYFHGRDIIIYNNTNMIYHKHIIVSNNPRSEIQANGVPVWRVQDSHLASYKLQKGKKNNLLKKTIVNYSMLQYSHLLSNRNIKSLKRGKTFYWKTTIVNYLLHAAFSVWFKSDFLSMFVFCRLLYVLPLTGPHGIFKASEIYYIVKLDYTIYCFCSRCM